MKNMWKAKKEKKRKRKDRKEETRLLNIPNDSVINKPDKCASLVMVFVILLFSVKLKLFLALLCIRAVLPATHVSQTAVTKMKEKLYL